jgi:hypothetical protein
MNGGELQEFFSLYEWFIFRLSAAVCDETELYP